MSRFIIKRTDKKVGKSPTLPKCSYHNCKNTFIGRYTVDLDINGFYYCPKHKKEIQLAMMFTVLGNEKMAMKLLGIPTPKNKSATKKQR